MPSHASEAQPGIFIHCGGSASDTFSVLKIQYFRVYATVQTHGLCLPKVQRRQAHSFVTRKEREKPTLFDPARLVKNRLVPITLTRTHHHTSAADSR